MLKKYQDIVNETENLIKSSTKKELTAYGKLSMLSAEIGELADEIIALEGDRVEDNNYNAREHLAKELVDVIYNTITIANHYKVNIDDYFEGRIAEIKSKF